MKRHLLYAFGVFVITMLIWFSLAPRSGDAWVYEPPMADSTMLVSAAIAIGLGLLVALIVYVFAAIRLIINRERHAHNPARRAIGIWMLVLPVVSWILLSGASLFGYVLPLLGLGLAIIGGSAFVLGPIVLFTMSIIKRAWWGTASLLSLSGTVIALIVFLSTGMLGTQMMYSMESGSLGLTAGGAQDIAAFRQNVLEGYQPQVTDITHEGVFSEYLFELEDRPCEVPVCTTYRSALSADPLSGELVPYLQVGLTTNISAEDFERKPLDLVIVLDISGSMSSGFNRYYYDAGETYDARSKMEVAQEAMIGIVDHLEADDRLGVVLFESDAHLARRLEPIEDRERLARNIRDVEPTGGTNMEAGLTRGIRLLKPSPDREQRVIFLTDAMPNTGAIGEDSLKGIAQDAADRGIYTTFIGIGVDFNTALVNELTDIEGANYNAVHDAESFLDKMVTGFDYLVTPLIFDLRVDIEGAEVERVYGTPQSDTIVEVATLFPSERVDAQTRGSVILVEFEEPLTRGVLVARYRDANGEEYEQRTTLLVTERGEHYQSSGIRKAILLQRYATLSQQWIADSEPPVELNADPIREGGYRSPWERRSSALSVSSEYRERFTAFREHFAQEAAAIGDAELEQELDVLDALLRVTR